MSVDPKVMELARLFCEDHWPNPTKDVVTRVAEAAQQAIEDEIEAALDEQEPT